MLHLLRQSISGLVAEYVVALGVTRVRFPADAAFVRKATTLSNRRRENSATGGAAGGNSIAPHIQRRPLRRTLAVKILCASIPPEGPVAQWIRHRPEGLLKGA